MVEVIQLFLSVVHISEPAERFMDNPFHCFFFEVHKWWKMMTSGHGSVFISVCSRDSEHPSEYIRTDQDVCGADMESIWSPLELFTWWGVRSECEQSKPARYFARPLMEVAIVLAVGFRGTPSLCTSGSPYGMGGLERCGSSRSVASSGSETFFRRVAVFLSVVSVGSLASSNLIHNFYYLFYC